MLDPRRDISWYPELIQILARGELPETVPHWLKVADDHPARHMVKHWEPEPVIVVEETRPGRPPHED